MSSDQQPQITAGPIDDASALPSIQPRWTILSDFQVKILLVIAAFAAAVSPFSTSTYYPAVVALSKGLGVSISMINLTISTYQIFQGIAPSFIAALADTYGRRPAFLLCFIIYFGANLGLALQNNYVALLVLRCLQSSGSSGTSALAQAVIQDLTTRAERGKYLAYVIIGATAGPALGPVVGGLLTQFLGWRAVFWFLFILGSVLCIIILGFFPETARSIVGDGSIPSAHWNKSWLQMRRSKATPPVPNIASLEHGSKHPNPFTSLALLRHRANFILCISGGLMYAGYTSVTSVLASQLQERYGYNAVEVGLCYLPVAFGSLMAAGTTAKLIDWNFKREAKKQGLSIEKNVQQDITHFDTEKARLLFAFPMIILSCGLITGYGWEMQRHVSLAPILVTMFFISNLLTGALISNTALLTDINRENAAAVGAATNLTRCLLSAGAVAIVGPMIKAVGIGWTGTITAAVWVLAGLGFGIIYFKGFTWRLEALAKKKRPEGQGGQAQHAKPEAELDQRQEQGEKETRREGRRRSSLQSEQWPLEQRWSIISN